MLPDITSHLRDLVSLDAEYLGELAIVFSREMCTVNADDKEA